MESSTGITERDAAVDELLNAVYAALDAALLPEFPMAQAIRARLQRAIERVRASA